tara:strand:+ start:52 stop:780 length:729 start_codon:yes stop_codon:yes gene_type:complete
MKKRTLKSIAGKLADIRAMQGTKPKPKSKPRNPKYTAIRNRAMKNLKQTVADKENLKDAKTVRSQAIKARKQASPSEKTKLNNIVNNLNRKIKVYEEKLKAGKIKISPSKTKNPPKKQPVIQQPISSKDGVKRYATGYAKGVDENPLTVRPKKRLAGGIVKKYLKSKAKKKTVSRPKRGILKTIKDNPDDLIGRTLMKVGLLGGMAAANKIHRKKQKEAERRYKEKNDKKVLKEILKEKKIK